MLVFPDAVTMVHLVKIAQFAVVQMLPSMFGWSEYCEAGGLLSYGANQRAQGHSWHEPVDFRSATISSGIGRSWLALDEQERIDLAIAYHRRYHLPMGNDAKLHGVAHVIVENQIAAGDPPAVREALDRLIAEGLDRHDAVHALGSIVMSLVFDVVQEKGDHAGDINAKYSSELAKLTAASWRGQR